MSSNYQKYLIISPEQLKRLRGETPLTHKLDQERRDSLDAATRDKTGLDYATFLRYQRALQKFLAQATSDASSSVQLPIDAPEALAAAAALTSTVGATASPSPGGSSPATPVSRRTRKTRTRGVQTVPANPLKRKSPAKKSRKKQEATPPSRGILGSWLSYGK